MLSCSSKATSALLVLLLAILGGCFAVPYMETLPPHQGISPNASPTLNQMKEARAALQAAINTIQTGRDKPCASSLKVTYALVECAADGSRIRIVETPQPTAVQTNGGTNRFHVEVQTVDGKKVKFSWGAPAWDGTPQINANHFVDAWAVLAAAGKESADSAAFEQQAKDYIAANPKPELPEEARRYKVQAEDAVKRRDFENAAEKYSQALQIALWWPQGHYNLALIYAELDLNARAIVEMKRYLQLVPNAENARQAQDKIYTWEAR